MINWPDSVINDIALRRSVIVLGSGISANSSNAVGQRPKTWKAFLEIGCDRVADVKTKREVKKLITQNDYLTACELVKTALGDNAFHALVIAEYQTPGYDPAEIHKTIYDLDSKIVITPNFDTIYDRYASNTSKGTIIIKRHTDNDIAEMLRMNNRLVLKIHGSVDTPNELTFTRASYAQARHKYKAMYEVLDALLITHTFLFLGCGTNDPDIRLLLEDYRQRFHHAGTHYFVLPKSSMIPAVKIVLEDTMKIHILEYATPNGQHHILQESIRNLAEQASLKRQEIAISQNW